MSGTGIVFLSCCGEDMVSSPGWIKKALVHVAVEMGKESILAVAMGKGRIVALSIAHEP
jgi:hypothetical protein